MNAQEIRVAVYLCSCGTNISSFVDFAELVAKIPDMPSVASVRKVPFLCSEEGFAELVADLAEQKPDRVVVAACSPRDHEETFRRALSEGGLNPYLLHMTNIREQCAWVTTDLHEATEKALRLIRGAVHRTARQRPLHQEMIDASPDVLIVGAGPAGLSAALMLAAAGRKITIIERNPSIGGLPVLFEKAFPSMQCAPCILEPSLDAVLHGPHASSIRVLTLSTISGVKGFFGSFEISITRKPRYVRMETCVGCGECVSNCPVLTDNPSEFGTGKKKAIDFSHPGALPNVPCIDPEACIRFRGHSCTRCRDVCPAGTGDEGPIFFNDREVMETETAGAVIIATGASLLDCRSLRHIPYGTSKLVVTSMEFERLAASDGPTGGNLPLPSPCDSPSVVILHCAGSLDCEYKEYCSEICCGIALKYNIQIRHQYPHARIVHLYREICLTGGASARILRNIRNDGETVLIRYESLRTISVTEEDGLLSVSFRTVQGTTENLTAMLMVLCPATVPGQSAGFLSEVFGIGLNNEGFFGKGDALNGAFRTAVRGVFIAGSCRGPCSIGTAVTEGCAAAGAVLSELHQDVRIEIPPVWAEVSEGRCSGCGICASVCPYHAIVFDSGRRKAFIRHILCSGCGICTAACPAGAIDQLQNSDEEICAETGGILAR